MPPRPAFLFFAMSTTPTIKAPSTKRGRGRPRKEPVDALIRPAEAARRLGVHRSVIGEWIEGGKLAAVIVDGDKLRVRESSVAALIRPYEPRRAPFSFFAEGPRNS